MSDFFFKTRTSLDDYRFVVHKHPLGTDRTHEARFLSECAARVWQRRNQPHWTITEVTSPTDEEQG